MKAHIWFCVFALLQARLAICDNADLKHAVKRMQDDLNSLGAGTFTLLVPDSSGKVITQKTTTLYSNAVVNVQTCVVRFHVKIVSDGRTVRDSDDELHLRELHVLEVAPLEPTIRSAPSLSGVKVVPPIFLFRAIDAETTPLSFPFVDESAAERLRSEVVRVAALCGKQ